jgi:hypothetical protein
MAQSVEHCIWNQMPNTELHDTHTNITATAHSINSTISAQMWNNLRAFEV